MRTVRVVAPVLALVLLVVLAGCGQDASTSARLVIGHQGQLADHIQPTSTTAPTTVQLWRSFQGSLAKLTSIHAKGTETYDGATATVDLVGTIDGATGRSTLVRGTQTMDMVVVDHTYYVKANSEFLRANGFSAQDIVAIGSRYLATGSSEFSALTAGYMVQNLRSMGQVSASDPIISEKSTLQGRPVYVFSFTVQEGRVTVWVTDTAFTLLRLRVEATGDTSDYTFSEWNYPVTASAPPEAQVIRLPG